MTNSTAAHTASATATPAEWEDGDAALLAAIFASPDFVVWTPEDWQLDCEHPDTDTDSAGWTRCLVCGKLYLA